MSYVEPDLSRCAFKHYFTLSVPREKNPSGSAGGRRKKRVTRRRGGTGPDTPKLTPWQRFGSTNHDAVKDIKDTETVEKKEASLNASRENQVNNLLTKNKRDTFRFALDKVDDKKLQTVHVYSASKPAVKLNGGVWSFREGVMSNAKKLMTSVDKRIEKNKQEKDTRAAKTLFALLYKDAPDANSSYSLSVYTFINDACRHEYTKTHTFNISAEDAENFEIHPPCLRFVKKQEASRVVTTIPNGLNKVAQAIQSANPELLTLAEIDINDRESPSDYLSRLNNLAEKTARQKTSEAGAARVQELRELNAKVEKAEGAVRAATEAVEAALAAKDTEWKQAIANLQDAQKKIPEITIISEKANTIHAELYSLRMAIGKDTPPHSAVRYDYTQLKEIVWGKNAEQTDETVEALAKAKNELLLVTEENNTAKNAPPSPFQVNPIEVSSIYLMFPFSFLNFERYGAGGAGAGAGAGGLGGGGAGAGTIHMPTGSIDIKDIATLFDNSTRTISNSAGSGSILSRFTSLVFMANDVTGSINQAVLKRQSTHKTEGATCHTQFIVKYGIYNKRKVCLAAILNPLLRGLHKLDDMAAIESTSIARGPNHAISERKQNHALPQRTGIALNNSGNAETYKDIINRAKQFKNGFSPFYSFSKVRSTIDEWAEQAGSFYLETVPEDVKEDVGTLTEKPMSGVQYQVIQPWTDRAKLNDFFEKKAIQAVKQSYQTSSGGAHRTRCKKHDVQARLTRRTRRQQQRRTRKRYGGLAADESKPEWQIAAKVALAFDAFELDSTVSDVQQKDPFVAFLELAGTTSTAEGMVTNSYFVTPSSSTAGVAVETKSRFASLAHLSGRSRTYSSTDQMAVENAGHEATPVAHAAADKQQTSSFGVVVSPVDGDRRSDAVQNEILVELAPAGRQSASQ
jgi:hypothetical protein